MARNLGGRNMMMIIPNLTFHYELPNKVGTITKVLIKTILFGKYIFSCMVT